MSERVEADVVEIRAAAEWIDESAIEFRGEVEQLLGQVREVLGDSWQGPAATSHGEQWDQWQASMATIIDALGDSAVLLRSNADSYSATDSGTAQSLGGIDGSLNIQS